MAKFKYSTPGEDIEKEPGVFESIKETKTWEDIEPAQLVEELRKLESEYEVTVTASLKIPK